MKWNALLVDDEGLARQRLRRLLQSHADRICIQAEAGSGEEAVAAVRRLRPDLVFLDIQMPEMDGFQVLRALDQVPLVIFVTAYDDFALQAFEENSVDYLLKPVEPARLARAIAKLDELGAGRVAFSTSIQRLLHRLEPPTLKRIQVKLGSRTLLIKTDDVLYFSAEDKYTVLHTRDHAYLIADSLNRLEERLDGSEFLRIHRAYLVRIDRIKEVQSLFKGKLMVVMDDATKTNLGVGRTFNRAVKDL